MIPVKDVSRTPQRFPAVTVCIILANIAVFFAELAGGDAFITRWGEVPAQITSGHHWITIFTSMFMHASVMHIAGNMLFFWVFGPAVEDAMGPWRYLAFYLVGGVVASLTQTLVSPHSTVVSLGASGAIAAVMGAFLVTYPGDKIRTVVFLGIFVGMPLVSAALLVGLWFILQLISANAAVISPHYVQQGGVAYFAHVGGFLFGALFGRLFETPGEQPAPGTLESY